MILELGVITLGYAGSELFRRYKKKPSQKLANKLSSKRQSLATVTVRKGQILLKNSQKKAIEKQADHFLKWSLVTVALTIFRGTNPFLFTASVGSLLYINTPLLQQSYLDFTERRQFGHAGLTTGIFAVGLLSGYHFALAVGGSLYFLGSKIMVNARGSSEAFFHDIFENQPQSGWVLKDGIEVELPLKAIQPQDIVVVKMGELVPVDGIIVEGQALIDQQALTGEFQPAEKGLGDQVLASTLVLGGQIYIQVEKSGEETTISKIADVLSRSFDHQNKIQLKGQAWADKSSLPFLLAGGLSFFTLGPAGAIVVMNSRPGNGIRLLGALGTLNYIKSAAQHGVIIKDGAALETLKDVEVVIFDKTGTLTLEQPQVGRIFQYDTAYQTLDILRYAAAVEGRLHHPIAKAIVEQSRACSLTLPELDDSTYEVGYGIKAYIEGNLIHVGSTRFMEIEQIPLTKPAQDNLEQAQLEGNTLIFVAIGHKLMGGIEIKATLRTETPMLLQKLRQHGIEHISIVSGDYEQPTKALANSLQMDSYFSEILPENKASIVEMFQNQGHKVCFIGDGINDAIAMQQADVAISLSGASSIAVDVAQIVVMQDSLMPVYTAFDISRKLNRNLLYSLSLVSILPTFLNLSGFFFLHIGVLGSFLIKNIAFVIGLGNTVLQPKYQSRASTLQLQQTEAILPEKLS